MVVLSCPPMSTASPVLVGAGALPELVMRDATTALAEQCRRHLLCIPIGACPQTVLSETAGGQELLRLSGDAAVLHPSGGTWFEALADWQRPVLMLVRACPDGAIPGTAAAYNALAERLRVPLIGLVQLEGDWDSAQRIRDGLPWCGWIPHPQHPLREAAVIALAQRLLSSATTAGSALL